MEEESEVEMEEGVRDGGDGGGCQIWRRVSQMEEMEEGVNDGGDGGGCQRWRRWRMSEKWRWKRVSEMEEMEEGVRSLLPSLHV